MSLTTMLLADAVDKGGPGSGPQGSKGTEKPKNAGPKIHAALTSSGFKYQDQAGPRPSFMRDHYQRGDQHVMVDRGSSWERTGPTGGAKMMDHPGQGKYMGGGIGPSSLMSNLAEKK